MRFEEAKDYKSAQVTKMKDRKERKGISIEKQKL